MSLSKILDIPDNQEDFNINVLEALGALVLCIHWIRGTFRWLEHTNAITFPTQVDRDNFERLFGNIELYEQIVWEIAPSRAMLIQLRERRKSGILAQGYEVLATKDSHGRIPFTVQPHDWESIQALLKKLGDLRSARSADVDMSAGPDNALSYDDMQDLLRRLGEAGKNLNR